MLYFKSIRKTDTMATNIVLIKKTAKMILQLLAFSSRKVIDYFFKNKYIL